MNCFRLLGRLSFLRMCECNMLPPISFFFTKWRNIPVYHAKGGIPKSTRKGSKVLLLQACTVLRESHNSLWKSEYSKEERLCQNAYHSYVLSISWWMNLWKQHEQMHKPEHQQIIAFRQYLLGQVYILQSEFTRSLVHRVVVNTHGENKGTIQTCQQLSTQQLVLALVSKHGKLVH